MADMDKVFVFLPHLEGDSWIRADYIIGIYRAPGSTRTEIHLDNGEITLTDLTVPKVLQKLQEVWESVDG